MQMLATLRELLRYEAWADQKILACVDEHDAWADTELRDRFHHAHVVQRVFLRLLTGREPDLAQLEIPFESLSEFRRSASQYAHEMESYVAQLDGGDLEQTVRVPWFGQHTFSTGQILLQVVMHSQHHRGQNAARLKQLGQVPPTFDYIVWLSRGKLDPTVSLIDETPG